VSLARAVRSELLERHRSAFERPLACADAVAAEWDGAATTDRTAVVDAYRAALQEADAREPLVAALVAAIDATDHQLAATPVPDLPYLAITGRGVVLRGPLSAGGRVVATLRAFEVDPYRRGPDLPEALAVERRDG